jgi:small subunit ribosomal protein S9
VTDESTPAPADDATTSEDAVSDAAAAPEAVEETTAEATPTESETPSAEDGAEAPATGAAEEVSAAEEAAPAAEAADEAAPAAEAPDEAGPASETEAAESAEAAPAPTPEEPPARPAPRRTAASKGGKPTPSLGTGRRKGAVARVRLVPGSGLFDLDGRTLEDVFPNRAHRMQITAPLRIADRERDLDVLARLHGGGVSGQAGALRHGIARALIELDPELRARLKAEGFLTRDSREKERRKYGLKKARKAPQYSKR